MTTLEEMYAILMGDKDVLMHYGKGHLDGGHSGRYPYGSGADPNQHPKDFLDRVDELKANGWSETPENIKNEFGITTTQYRIQKSYCKDERRMRQVARAKELKANGMGETEIARVMGAKNESTVRSWLNESSESKMKQARETADALKKLVDEKGMIDVGTSADLELRVSKEKLNEALYILQMEGYPVYGGRFEQMTNKGKYTTQKVLCPPGTEHKDIYNLDQVHNINDYISRDGGKTIEKKFHYPESLDSSRLMIRYREDGGLEKDGVVELRRGVDDLSLGESRYAQVRILVDGTHYIKGMAVYSDAKDWPEGVDAIFNTNKGKDKSKLEVLKAIKEDPDNPFGSAIKDADQGGQYWYTDKKTGERKLGLINKRADEGDWTEWKDAIPSQFLGKQSITLAKKQLDLAKADKEAEYDDICNITNPTIKKYMLEKFADNCDSAAVHLQAAALPGQKYNVIIPITSMKDTEVYAPRYENGTKLALIRYPHGGTFEIPILTVNNNQKTARELLGTDISDAIGINSKVAEQLSGADFDGDTVMCIPTHDKKGKVKISSKPGLEGLIGFDPKESYPERAGMKYMKDPKTGSDSTQMEMGKISNLITDMTLAGASDAELACAVRHSMVVIDAGKHRLDYKQSEVDNHISDLRLKYQGKTSGGASTLISQAKGQYTVPKRQGTYKVNQKGKDWYDPSRPEGAKIWKVADDLYYPDRSYDKSTGIITIKTVDGKKVKYNVADKEAKALYSPIKKIDESTGNTIFTNSTGEYIYKTKTRHQKSTKMAETDDANTLLSDARHPMELVYADYANSMKSLANKARLEMVNTPNLKYDKTAAETYSAEVSSLNAKLNTALLNAPKERAAQRLANVEVSKKKAANPNMKNDDISKAQQQAISKYRVEVGSIKRRDRNINITDREWEAIQAGAITDSKLRRILANADIDILRERATPKTKSTLSDVKINRIRAMANSNYTVSEIAEKLGISSSTVLKYVKGES